MSTDTGVTPGVSGTDSEHSEAEEIESTAAPLVEHLVELRQRLVRALIAVAVVFVIAFYFADEIFQFLVIPYERAAGENQKLQLFSRHLRNSSSRSCASLCSPRCSWPSPS